MKKESMLVVEDEDIMREALVDYFSDVGHKVDTANDGDKDLKKYNLEDYDVMIIDLKLPGRNGLSVLKEVRVKNPKAKVIMITAYPSVETEEEAIRRGAIDYLTKPFELDYLETLIKQPYEFEIVPPPPVEEPVVVEERLPSCIWMQAGIVNKRTCPNGYQCEETCQYHAAMMKKEKFRSDPRIEPFIAKLHDVIGGKLCRYVMTGDIAVRLCPRVYHCEICEFDQAVQDDIDNAKIARRNKTPKESFNRVTMM